MKTNWKLLTQMVGILRNEGHTLQFPREPGLLQGCEHIASWAATTQAAGWYAPGPGTEPTGQVSLSVPRMTLESWQPSNNKKRGQTCSGASLLEGEQNPDKCAFRKRSALASMNAWFPSNPKFPSIWLVFSLSLLLWLFLGRKEIHFLLFSGFW